MTERDPFGKEGRINILDTPERDRFSVEGDRESESESESVFGSVSSFSVMDEEEAHVKKKKMKAWVIGGLVVSTVVLLLAGAFGWTWYRANIFKSDRVTLSVKGPEATSGNNTEHFVLEYENQNSVALENAVLLFRFPDNFIPEEKNGLKRDGTTSARVELGTIGAKQKGMYDFYGYFSGTTESTLYIRTGLQYSPKSITGSFQQETQKSVRMETSVVGVEMVVPIEAASSDTADISVQYQNRGKETLFSLRLKMQYPDGFEFANADMRPSEGNTVWYLDPLAPGETRTLKLHGRISGDRESFREFSALFGVVRGDNSFLVYGKDTEKVKLVGSPFSIKTTINFGNVRTVFPGNELKCSVQYSNDGEVGLGNAVVQVSLGGKILDEQMVVAERGSYDAATKTITWRASDVPDLAFVGPKKGGKLDFSIYVKKNISIETENDTRFVGSITASIDSADVPDRIGTRRIVARQISEVLLGTNVTIATDVREDGTNINLPEVDLHAGKETALVVYVRLRNAYNDVSDGKFSVGIPSGVSFSEMIDLGRQEDVMYDERSQQLIWNVGDFRAGTGFVLPDRVVAFRIKVTPQEYQSNGTIVLLNQETFQGRDLFIGDAVNASYERIVATRVLR